jgi:hypothetical protein
MPTETAMNIIKAGSIRLKVKRSGMLQFLVFTVRRVSVGKEQFVELYVDRLLEMREVERVANETGLPVEAESGRIFPTGKGAKDFMGL